MIRETAEVINVLNALSCLIVSGPHVGANFSFSNQTTFCYLHDIQGADMDVCFFTSVFVLFCYTLHWRLNKNLKCSDLISDLGTFSFLAFMLAILTPVLQSLTVAYSSDTVTLMVVSFCICHLWSYDFESSRSTIEPQNTPVVRSPTSLNAIFVAAILLSSRLSKFTSVFLLLFQSLVLFGFGPFFRTELRNCSRHYYEVLTVSCLLMTSGVIFAMNHLIGVIYLLSALAIAFGGPILFIYAYRFKK